MRATRRAGWAALAAAVLLAVTGCSGGDVLAKYQPQVVNAADQFRFQVSGLNAVTTTHEYTWSNAGQKAGVEQVMLLGGGAGTITIFDAANTQVYQQPIGTAGVQQTLSGAPGRWRIRVELSGASGSVGVRVQTVIVPVVS